MNTKYTIGVDFGTLSARAVLVNTENGKVVTDAVFTYPHGVIDTCLPGSDIPLPHDFALQHPKDYLEAFAHTVSTVIGESGVDPKSIIGVCVDFTSCTLLPITSDGTPLCILDEFKNEPHAYVKLWKHHSAQPYAERINELALKYVPEKLKSMGGSISCEWVFPKIMETLDKAPDVYENAAYFLEAADFISLMLTGKQTRSYVFAAYKALYTREDGYLPKKMLAELDPRLENVVEEKLNAPIISSCESAGFVDAASRKRFGLDENAPWLAEGTVVAAPLIDAHASAPALNMSHSGDMFAIFGTSSNYMLVNKEYKQIPGICGVVRGGLFKDLNDYESGLCCFGDHFAWCSENICTEEYRRLADERGISPLQLLSEKAEALAPGECGIIALNWWNGNRNPLINSSLSGMFLGMTLRSKPEDLFRALVEANAFGTRLIIETFENNGIKAEKLSVAGGIALKSPFIMQLISDVLGKELYVTSYLHSAALACSIYASVTAGSRLGGYDTMDEACAVMSAPVARIYSPNKKAHETYNTLYAEYIKLVNYFGRGENDVMKRLRDISAEAISNK